MAASPISYRRPGKKSQYSKGDDADFAYVGLFGPEYWDRRYGDCSGMLQSPIDLDTGLAEEIWLKPIRFSKAYSTEIQGKIQNQGHTSI